MKKTFLQHVILVAMVTASICQHSIAQWAASGTNLYNTNTGKVGIGTSTTTIPSGLLTIKGSGGVPASSWVSSGSPLFVGLGEASPGNADFNLMMASATVNARGVLGMKRARGTLATPAAVTLNDQLGSLLVSGFDGTNFQGSAAVDFFADGTPSANNVPARISFVTGTNGSNRTERLRIGNSGNISFNNNQLTLNQASGNLGLGLSAATRARLEINGSVGAAVAIFGGDKTGVAIQADNPEIGFNYYYNGTTKTIKKGGYGVNVGMYPSTGDFYIGNFNGNKSDTGTGNITGYKQVLTVAQNGNVGIGKSSPLYNLDINGTNTAVNINGTSASIYLNNSSINTPENSGDLYISSAKQPLTFPPSPAPGNLLLQVPTSNPFINYNAGNVGIGTSDPALGKLVVQGKVGNTVAAFRGSSSSKGIALVADFPGVYFNSYWNAGQKAMAPGYAAIVNFDPDAGFLTLGTSSTAASVAGEALSTGTTMTLDKNGNVGIGATPFYKLDVCGVIRGKEVRVETGWCDFVFADDYKLRSLKDVEEFIQINKHLPDVTPGPQIENEGLEVGKTSAQMIRKIEELTLYVIEQDKAINSLKAQNAKLESAINSLIEKGGK